MRTESTQVATIGAGPAGLFLGHLLRAEGNDCVVLERRTPDYVLGRIRTGLLEQVTVGLMERLGLDARLKAKGLVKAGLDLAASDVRYAAEALIGWFRRNDADGMAGYSARALALAWKSQRFSWSLAKPMHRFPEDGPFERAMQVAELEYIASSKATQTTIAENYASLPV